MDIQKKPTLAEKQAFWTEQLPNFESKYWLPSHFDFLVFDMDQGNYVIKDDLDKSLDDDATEIWHRVNTGWTMWKKAINFSKEQSQKVTVPDTYTAVVLALENVQTEVSHSSFVTMDADNESEIYAVDANKLSKYIDDLIEAQEN